MHRLFSLLLLISVIGQAHGVDSVWVQIPHDDARARKEAQELPVSIESALLLKLIESLALADRSKEKTGLEFPDCFQCLSKTDIEKRLGLPFEFVAERYARPCLGAEIVFPLGGPIGDIKTFESRLKFYELKDVGGILVLYTTKGVAISPAIVYLRVDEEFVPLRKRQDVMGRLEWEVPRLRKLKKWLLVPEAVAKDNKGEFRITRVGIEEK